MGVAVVAAMLGACAGQPPEPRAEAGPSAPTAQIDPAAARFLANRRLDDLALSPDGTQLAAIESRGAEDRIVVVELADPALAPRPLVRERRAERDLAASRSIRTLAWVGDSFLVYAIESALRSEEDGFARPRGRTQRPMFQQRPGVGTRARKTRLYATDLEGRSRYLARRWPDADVSQFQHQIIGSLPDDPIHVLLNYQGRAIRVDVRNGGRLTIEPAARAEVASWAADHAGAIRAGQSGRGWDRHHRFFARRSPSDPWITVSDYDPYTEPGMWFAGFGPDPSRIYVFSDQASDRTTLHEYDLATRRPGPPITADAPKESDVTGVLLAQADDRLLALVACSDRCGLSFLDPALGRSWDRLAADFPDRNISILSRSHDDAHWIVEISSDVAAPEIHRFEPATGAHTKLFDAWPELAGHALAPMQTVRYRTRDGVEIEAYWTRPIGVEGPGPVIVMPHDGPDDRDDWGFDPIVQYLAARGFSVLQPNYRGSSGYGRAFWLRGHGEWGGAVVDDVIDGAAALVASGVADPDRIGLFGRGFGGYLALQALVEAPASFAAGASFGAITDLEILMSDDERFVGRAAVDEKVVRSAADEHGDRLATDSPAQRAGEIRAPILLAHGAQDPSHHEKHADAMASALERAGKPFESIRYPGATQGFLDDRDRIAFYSRLGDFFERHLIGRTVAQGDRTAPATERQAEP